MGLVNAAALLVFDRTDDGELVGTAAIKRPYPEYRHKVFRKAGSSEQPGVCPELGYLHVKEGFRGQGRSNSLVDVALRPYAGVRIYATTRTSNVAMRATLVKFGFHESGAPFPSEEPGAELLLFIRPGG